MNEQAVFDALKYRVEVDEDGTRRYYNGPGQLHRTDGPSVENANGSKFWYQNGLLHRTDGPAVEWTSGPAIEWVDGAKWWYQNDQLHRTDGPAIEYPDGSKEWWLNDKRVTEDEFNQAVKDYV